MNNPGPKRRIHMLMTFCPIHSLLYKNDKNECPKCKTMDMKDFNPSKRYGIRKAKCPKFLWYSCSDHPITGYM